MTAVVVASSLVSVNSEALIDIGTPAVVGFVADGVIDNKRASTCRTSSICSSQFFALTLPTIESLFSLLIVLQLLGILIEG
jgi:hypothetical protein